MQFNVYILVIQECVPVSVRMYNEAMKKDVKVTIDKDNHLPSEV